VTVHREQNMKSEDKLDATIRCLLLTSVSTCFGHHYAHLQENKGSVTAFGVLFWICWMWLVAVVGRCLAGCEHSHPARQRHTPNAVTGPLFS
jgi:glycerol-3-phosphate acyltransferase PlsY